MAPKHMICYAEGKLFNLIFLKLNVVICVLAVYSCSCSVKQMASIFMLDTAISLRRSTQNIFPISLKAFMLLRAPSKDVGQISQVKRKLDPRSVLNAGVCHFAEIWIVFHIEQKHNL